MGKVLGGGDRFLRKFKSFGLGGLLEDIAGREVSSKIEGSKKKRGEPWN